MDWRAHGVFDFRSENAMPIRRNYSFATNPAVDHQLDETMIETGLLFLAGQLVLGLFVWQASNKPRSSDSIVVIVKEDELTWNLAHPCSVLVR